MNRPKAKPGSSRAERRRVLDAQRVVLACLLDVHPKTPTPTELEAQLGRELEPPVVARAIENLCQAGFAERRGDALAPSPAALAFHNQNCAASRW